MARASPSALSKWGNGAEVPFHHIVGVGAGKFLECEGFF